MVEEVKTETKKWVITSVTDPRTNQKISFDDALIELVLDQENGRYCNPETGQEMSIGVAIERNLIQVGPRNQGYTAHTNLTLCLN